MTDVLPSPNFSPDSNPWRRAVTDRTVDMEKDVARIQSGTQALNRSFASQLGQLSGEARSVPESISLSQTFSRFPISSSFTTVASLAVPGKDGTQFQTLVTWGFRATSEPGPNGAYTETRLLVNSASQGTYWVRWGRNYEALMDEHTSSSGVTVSSWEGEDLMLEVQVRKTNDLVNFPVADTRMYINALVVYNPLH